ncbi:hypothetical protein A3C98_01660 [Candidatus Roizmanbacteria bacterium RIFCSPHIGHO2_02_FULL_37_15]|uniref:alanine--tRNA ligase n=1 Tax=Candidatus Roizmanbacteria bacterium RIFCSPLOWO2_01_FULL_37_16 TaxID=1802058 RepID=A0A1F7IM08_9BACT|nr:MAG: hypothetical protein A2859_00110 [Candidatus Roizmanbacteria bacterium RIFCSPHIGHO2_01_FULL_37_16b]OGK20894.1 MAG: hypothetical protein A3C98_01660 [Candidatus Roizmanbacteria bacterium RIFCSPHIGHO2_02_FULL_37_15]OGK33775.1 MAG: hypothetical protein A3F57_00840 [Candidatus Roizmanbacteria bacterium RIFCSPHIGHO2_12_FULL_36_11]OGK44310.1 MAG: hypothetical protein A3B40_01590 [Candidatus Roizmanbacteria bacterium RIFCSPLOWO2_01_FULL_37_16]OGK57824.1 MAG: hypothetical protein A3I50_03745 [C
MSLSHQKLRQKFSEFWQQRNHKLIPPIPLIPKDDPTTLFTGSGMQQLVPYLLGKSHPLGKKLYNIQPCFRSQDIDEVGDNRHTTFFEMMGNWSLGDYFKEEQLEWCWRFFTKELNLPKNKLYITVFAGTKLLPRDNESAMTWRKLGIAENHIFSYGPEKNWWSRSGVPENMPAGEPGGPDTEVFYEFVQVTHNPKFGSKCHPNCDCGRFLEIGNSVFMQYQKQKDGSFAELPKKNVDFGGGLERMLAALNNNPDMFKIDVIWPIIKSTENISGKKYRENDDITRSIRILADHMRSSALIAADGVIASNKDQGYFLRRLLRKMVRQGKNLGIEDKICVRLLPPITKIFKPIYPQVAKKQQEISKMFADEEEKFRRTLAKARIVVEKLIQKPPDNLAQIAFDLFQSLGYPPEIFLEDLKEKNVKIDINKFNLAYKQIFANHQKVSQKGADKKFKGGLADSKDQTIKYHSATHLLHQALFDILGDDIRQEGSNITVDRLRFDFYSAKKPTQPDIDQVLKIINSKIKEKLSVYFKIMPKEKAFKIGARAFFREKYPEMVKIYFIGGSTDLKKEAYSKEFCGGPHVQSTKDIGNIEIFRFEKIGSNLYRIYAK